MCIGLSWGGGVYWVELGGGVYWVELGRVLG